MWQAQWDDIWDGSGDVDGSRWSLTRFYDSVGNWEYFFFLVRRLE